MKWAATGCIEDRLVLLVYEHLDEFEMSYKACLRCGFKYKVCGI